MDKPLFQNKIGIKIVCSKKDVVEPENKFKIDIFWNTIF